MCPFYFPDELRFKIDKNNRLAENREQKNIETHNKENEMIKNESTNKDTKMEQNYKATSHVEGSPSACSNINICFFEDADCSSDSDKENLPMTDFESQFINEFLETPIEMSDLEDVDKTNDCMLNNKCANSENGDTIIFDNVEPEIDCL
ncbi:unnamed protein product [Psylliodes chrysocephalus]|uniref:Uncharacterized protein n=1 Tax=Psylliodes chrysocephalus TaxID=3402493 RepID=A0A9P0D3I2_9CUCU|nr:unnamed protein product [Psylliodes chrysocephala]